MIKKEIGIQLFPRLTFLRLSKSDRFHITQRDQNWRRHGCRGFLGFKRGLESYFPLPRRQASRVTILCCDFPVCKTETVRNNGAVNIVASGRHAPGKQSMGGTHQPSVLCRPPCDQCQIQLADLFFWGGSTEWIDFIN